MRPGTANSVLSPAVSASPSAPPSKISYLAELPDRPHAFPHDARHHGIGRRGDAAVATLGAGRRRAGHRHGERRVGRRRSVLEQGTVVAIRDPKHRARPGARRCSRRGRSCLRTSVKPRGDPDVGLVPVVWVDRTLAGAPSAAAKPATSHRLPVHVGRARASGSRSSGWAGCRTATESGAPWLPFGDVHGSKAGTRAQRHRRRRLRAGIARRQLDQRRSGRRCPARPPRGSR